MKNYKLKVHFLALMEQWIKAPVVSDDLAKQLADTQKELEALEPDYAKLKTKDELWQKLKRDVKEARNLLFSASGIYPQDDNNKVNGFSVRLVRGEKS